MKRKPANNIPDVWGEQTGGRHRLDPGCLYLSVAKTETEIEERETSYGGIRSVGWHAVWRGKQYTNPHLIQSGVSSASNIPCLISSNNQPFSSCPNRERSQTWERVWSLSFTCSLAPSTLCLLAGDGMIRWGRKQQTFCHSKEAIAPTCTKSIVQNPRRNASSGE